MLLSDFPILIVGGKELNNCLDEYAYGFHEKW